MESIHEAVHILNSKLFNYPWYAKKSEVNQNLYNSIVAYVNRMDIEVLTTVPDKIDVFDVRIHFIGSMKDGVKTGTITPSKSEKELVLSPVYDVHNKLWELQRICGKEALINIFYEVHDQNNAVTHVSPMYPEVRLSLSEMYDEFGFDVLYEELEG